MDLQLMGAHRGKSQVSQSDPIDGTIQCEGCGRKEKVICVATVSTKPIQISTILVSGRIVRLSEKCRNFFFERVER